MHVNNVECELTVIQFVCEAGLGFFAGCIRGVPQTELDLARDNLNILFFVMIVLNFNIGLSILGYGLWIMIKCNVQGAVPSQLEGFINPNLGLRMYINIYIYNM